MWNSSEVKRLWCKTIADLKIKHPVWMQLLRDAGYRAIVVDKKANYYGQCSYRDKTVSINLHLHRHSLEKDIIDTMLHEIAHAVDMCVHGVSSGHGKNWKLISSELGSKPKSTKSVAKKVQYKYVMCVHDYEKQILWFGKGYNRKPSRTPIGKFIQGMFFERDREGTMDKVIVYPWVKWCKMCDTYGVGYYREEHRDE